MNNLLFAADKALYLIVVLSAVPIIVATVVGLTVALIQAVTHLQEQTLPFGLKLLAVCLCIYLMAGWLGSRLLNFGDDILRLAFQ
ncbi:MULTISPECIES: EscS/YscS/HrcS family type III secretion system export apparatus protein [Pseudomonadota]|uniref:EscS/YscS/HrcS family type III secretion system export apparatus protein n=1 Tax=Pseudomonadota TaxID=1224 RepID=UPI000E03FCA4|nr:MULTISPECIES: EscS/YscS/HrcS family type III secretion system export apparatus protein [Pseudomonadota]RBL82033.1 EscS/YscS/HrcS family type III secretion system export apparatus protein [Streptomyces cavourensis]MBP8322084.1 EscS/YscS/HrcS family type III secretion system export apparatus protein [Pseudomonas aeruginosa]MCZ8438931.1 EscS/YscS/HrcS family type III secretion system export apparatus protein [Achromobacter xylosoxidans]MDC6162346.1 EscS/YscS/HrcS family type III secretion syste